ncbi:glycoside hydrolase family 5 protein [Paxillus rubicundulus Ve08.2h10]|uniref:Glycoside hydrolase family 5 protein n=1 Tax=Paxillus rubicundulus Ve08.2h10 TaxID=930991 RepID=A0A0D0DH20_9AGAM|nr:glycoside hydrolase family 5 protein [Paxillus rubicundulus Ve08.2h10]
MTSYLEVSGTKIVDGDSKEVILRGAGLGGWMNMENFISGYPSYEFQIRAALAEVVGSPRKSAFFFDKASHSQSTRGIVDPRELMCPLDGMDPRVLNKEGFKHLDRVIDLCAQQGIYTILDLHAAPGGQNTDWHCDSGTHIANFWIHKDFQDRTIWLWTELAKHYIRWEQPTDPTHLTIVRFYERVYDAIRSVDTEHVILFDGSTLPSDFSHFGDVHNSLDYSLFGFPACPEDYVSSDEQRRWMTRIWNGEWGPVYAREQYDGVITDAINEQRYCVLKDQLAIYNKDRLSWSIWLYKDIGFQGMVYVTQETPYMTLLKDFLAKKHRLAVDAWGTDMTHVQHICQPLINHIAKESPRENQSLYPAPVWKMDAGRLSRSILVAGYLVKEWVVYFRGKMEAELDEIAKSFKSESCLRRDGLNTIVTADALVAGNELGSA